jgi:hypothetical protein
MNFIFQRHTLCAIAAFALLAGCGGGVSPGQSSAGEPTAAQLRALGATGAARFSRSVKSNHRGSWMAPDAKQAKNLLYVADESANDVLVYSYPAGKLTGTLTLGALAGSCGGCVAIFTNAHGQPTIYTPSGQSGIPGCGYDKSGNLFCDAYGTSGAFELFELPAGGSAFTAVSVSGAGSLRSGSVQWDGTDLAVGSGAGSTLYQCHLRDCL